MPSLEGTVNVPVIGSVSKKTATVYGGLALGVIAIAIVRRRRAESVSDQPAATGTDDAVYNADDGSYTVTPSYTGAQYGSAFGTGYTGAGPAEETDNTTTTARITNNTQWSTYAVEQLSNSGLEPTIVLAALGAYLQGRNVTDAQRSLIEQAIALAGQPPQAGTNGYPPSIRHVPSPVRGRLVAPAVASRYDTKYSYLSWAPVPNAKTYQVWTGSRLIGEISGRQAKVARNKTANQAVFVIARNVGGGYPASGHSNTVTVPKLPAPPAKKGKK